MTSAPLGQIDSVERQRLRGWAFDAALPGHPVSLLVQLNGVLVGRIIADRYRPDLAAAGIGDGRHAFEMPFDPVLSPLCLHRLSVVRERDGVALDRSPWLLEPVTSLDEESLSRLAPLLLDGVAEDPALLERRHAFLLDRLDAVRALRSADVTVGASEGKLALVVDQRVPDGRRDAGSQALLSHMAALRRLGYAVLFAAVDPSVPGAEPSAQSRLAALRITLCGPPDYTTLEEVLRRHGAAVDLVYLHRGITGFHYARLVRRHCQDALLLCAMADLEHVRLGRQAAIEALPDLARLARIARHRELSAAVEADLVLVHSTVEARWLRDILPELRVCVLPWAVRLRPVPTGFAARRGVAFLADYAHQPNLDAARRLIHDIMPLVWEHEPELPCLLAGSHLPPDLTGSDPRLVPVGHVPDLGRLFARVRLSVAPLAFGAGIKGKVLDSLAAGIPCVCTPIAAEGFEDWPPALTRWIAPDTHGIAAGIIALHRDPALNREAAEAGLTWADTHLSEPAIDRALQAALSGTRA